MVICLRQKLALLKFSSACAEQFLAIIVDDDWDFYVKDCLDFVHCVVIHAKKRR